MDRDFQKQVVRFVLMLLASFVLIRLTKGWITVAIAAAGAYYALSNRLGPALCIYVYFPLLITLDHTIVPYYGIMSLTIRGTPLAMGFLLILSSGKRRGSHRVPLGLLTLFCACAFASSIDGYCPPISYMKLLNFFIFLLGLWLGTQNLHRAPQDLIMIRAFFTALTFFIIFGSFCTIPFPSIAYKTGIGHLLATGASEAEIAMALKSSGQMALFAGVCNHSQTLSPFAASCFAWILCDMLFVIRKFSKPHALACLVAPFLLFMTRSRLAIVTFAAAFWMVMFYAGQKLRLSPKLKSRINQAMMGFGALLFCVAVVAELRNHAISRWIRKTDDLAGDTRSTSEAITESRMGLIGYMMADFRQNPLLGTGFQVDEKSMGIYRSSTGLVLSAPIEKGVLPVMVLSETGVLGATAFLAFLIAFYGGCTRKRYIVTATLFTVMLATNMGESTFFSPGGMGGILWIVCIVGGFVLDSQLIVMRERQMRMLA